MANIPFFVFLRLNYGLKDRVIAECNNVSAAENSSRGRNEPCSALPGWGRVAENKEHTSDRSIKRKIAQGEDNVLG